MKPVVLILVAHYLPGFKSGGPARSIANLVTGLGDQFSFKIITRDTDFGELDPYQDILRDVWSRRGLAEVYYLSRASMQQGRLISLLRNTQYDLLYLNSAFSPWFSILPLVARRVSAIRRQPVLVAPRGEFSPGALGLKAGKKATYLGFSKCLGLYGGVAWHASSGQEAADIGAHFHVAESRMYIARNLVGGTPGPVIGGRVRQVGTPLRVIFLSRITPKKNLIYALRVLQKVKCRVEFNIYGPVEDSDYWSACLNEIEQLPANVMAKYQGSVGPERVRAVMGEHDLFFLPTLGENFGHVISESLSSGTPVLLSDTTPWRDLGAKGIGGDLPLAEPGAFAEFIESFSGTDTGPMEAMRHAASCYAQEAGQDLSNVRAHAEMFHRVLAL